MGNKKARELAKNREHEQQWERARSERRAATTGVSAFAIGERRLQLIVMPSFEPARAWEIRQLDAKWSLYLSVVVSQAPEIVLVGYDLVSAEDGMLAAYFQRVTALSVPLSPRLESIGGADGTRTQLAVFGSLSSEWRFQWWSEPPPHWKPLADIAGEMLRTFAALGSAPTR